MQPTKDKIRQFEESPDMLRFHKFFIAMIHLRTITNLISDEAFSILDKYGLLIGNVKHSWNFEQRAYDSLMKTLEKYTDKISYTQDYERLVSEIYKVMELTEYPTPVSEDSQSLYKACFLTKDNEKFVETFYAPSFGRAVSEAYSKVISSDNYINLISINQIA